MNWMGKYIKNINDFIVATVLPIHSSIFSQVIPNLESNPSHLISKTSLIKPLTRYSLQYYKPISTPFPQYFSFTSTIRTWKRPLDIAVKIAIKYLDSKSTRQLANIVVYTEDRSVKEIAEEDGPEPTVEVQPDFELICWDFVSEPSTTGAFMLSEGKDGDVFTKADRINRALNDILGTVG